MGRTNKMHRRRKVLKKKLKLQFLSTTAKILDIRDCDAKWLRSGRVYSKHAKESPLAGFVSQSDNTE